MSNNSKNASDVTPIAPIIMNATTFEDCCDCEEEISPWYEFQWWTDGLTFMTLALIGCALVRI